MGFTRFTKNVLNVSALPDRVQNQASALKATFDQAGVDIKAALNALIIELEAITSANNIGADVSSVTTKTVQAILTAFEEKIANRYTKDEINTLVANDTNNLVADVDVNLTTGVITVTKKDGTKETIDTALEKVPAKFEIVESGDTFALKITNVDGTTTQADITQFMNVYDFGNTDEVAFEVSGTGNEKTVTASIRANSIGLDKLSLSVVSTLEGYMTSAKDSATAAKTSETNARTSEINAQTAANTATNKAQEASASATNAARSAEDAEYWAKQTQGNVQGGDMLKSVYDADGDGVVDEAANGIKILEASTDNVVDFDTLTEPGYYLIKNCSDTVGTTINSGFTSTNETARKDILLMVSSFLNPNGDLYLYHTKSNTYTSVAEQRYAFNGTWQPWKRIDIPASWIASGTFPAGVSCNTPTASKHIVNKEYADTKATKVTYTATIPATGWTETTVSGIGTGTGYIDVRVEGLTTADTPIISPVLSAVHSTALLQLEAWNKIEKIVTNGANIRAYAMQEIPTTEIPIQIMCIR